MSSRQYQPCGLPDIDGAEVVLLQGIGPSRVSGYMGAAEHAPHVVLSDTDAQLAARLWRNLPGGAQDRCHVPTYGVRFMRAGAPILQASICWECNNAFGSDLLGELHFEFDASAAIAQQLLQLFQAVLPAPSEVGTTASPERVSDRGR
jgi:hypothetical protein